MTADLVDRWPYTISIPIVYDTAQLFVGVQLGVADWGLCPRPAICVCEVYIIVLVECCECASRRYLID